MKPEAKVKADVKKLLNSYGEELDHFWPVQNGMGSPSLDCIGCFHGLHFEIETKAPGKRPTARQEQTILKKQKAKSPVFVIDSSECDDFFLLQRWLENVKMRSVVGDLVC